MLKKIIKKIIKILGYPFILGGYLKFKKIEKEKRFSTSIFDLYPCIKDKTIKTGFDRHYIYHTAWASRKVKQINPEFHTDISSSLYFAGLVSAFMPVKFYDFRPADLILDNLESLEGNLLSLPFEDNSINSLSCMHVVEHIGLGRYGDNFDYDGDLKAIKELKRVLAVGGSLLFVVPIGGEAKIQFNAHRIYTYDQILKHFEGLELKEFALIPEKNGEIIYNPDKSLLEKEEYACGCFWFVKSKN
jgi:SAM-dependent methyltransferase